jgi:hypothetical protein
MLIKNSYTLSLVPMHIELAARKVGSGPLGQLLMQRCNAQNAGVAAALAPVDASVPRYDTIPPCKAPVPPAADGECC